jgi:hypothetical protein
VGKIFNPYVESDPIFFDTANFSPLMQRMKISCPLITKANFALLMAHAKRNLFGLNLSKASGDSVVVEDIDLEPKLQKV